MVAAAAETAEAAAGALPYLGAGMPPPPGSRPLQVSWVRGISAASPPARGSGQAAHLLLLPPPRQSPSLCRRLPAGGLREVARVDQRGKGAARDLGPSLRGFQGPQAAPAGAPRRAPPAGREKGRRPLAHPHGHITVSSSIPVLAPAPRLRALLTWVCGRSRGAAGGYHGALRWGAGCSARLGSAGRRASPAFGPASPPAAAPPPPPVPGPFATAAVTQRAGNGYGEGL